MRACSLLDSIRRAADERADISTICYALQISLAYWLCKVGGEREKLCRKLDAEWPLIKQAQLEELLQ